MCISSRSVVAWLLLAVVSVSAQEPNLGEVIDADALAQMDFVVLPDGRGLPPGNGNVADGRELYVTHCIACHGADGVGGINDRLAGGHGSLTSEQPIKTVGSFWPYATTLFDYVRRAMPYQEPGSLSNDEIYAVVAYLLYINDIVDGDTSLSARSLPDVKMPNAGNFVWRYEEGQGEK